MRLTIYDKAPGDRLTDHALAFWWWVGCVIQKLFGQVDDYYGAETWADAKAWLDSKPGPFMSVQYWGHGSQGTVWLAGKPVGWDQWLLLKSKMLPTSLLWFRICSSFGGRMGQQMSQVLADGLNCIVAGHTRIIGFIQGGLHTRKPNTPPSWAESEQELTETWLTDAGLQWGNNSIFRFQTKIPDGW